MKLDPNKKLSDFLHHEAMKASGMDREYFVLLAQKAEEMEAVIDDRSHCAAQGIKVAAESGSESSRTEPTNSPTPLGVAPKADRERSVGLSEEEIREIGNKLACDPQFSGHYRNGHMEGVTKALRYARDHFSKLSGEQAEKIIHAVMAARAWCKDKDMPDTAAYFEACVRDAIKAANLYP